MTIIGQARRAPVALVVEQVVFVLGGDTDTAEWYDAESEPGCWVMSSVLPRSLESAGGCVVTW